MTSIEIASDFVDIENDQLDPMTAKQVAERWVETSSNGMMEHLRSVSLGKEESFKAHFVSGNEQHSVLYERLKTAIFEAAAVSPNDWNSLVFREVPDYSEDGSVFALNLEVNRPKPNLLSELGRYSVLY